MSDPGPWPQTEGLDRWEQRATGMGGQEPAGLSCSFCGSLHPDRFMELLEQGWILGPTDKSYKAYLARPYTDAEVADQRQRWLANNPTVRAIRSLGERDGKTDEQIAADVETYRTTLPDPAAEGRTLAKFYFQHLSEAQRDRFIELHNAHQLRIGYPGRLYVTPFFATHRPPATT